MHTNMHTYIHTYIHTYKYTYIHREVLKHNATVKDFKKKEKLFTIT